MVLNYKFYVFLSNVFIKICVIILNPTVYNNFRSYPD